MLARNIYNIERIADGVAGSQVLDTRTFKGAIDITFNFNFPVAINEAIKLKVTHDGKTLLFKQGSSLPSTFTHTLAPSPTDYLNYSTFQIIVVYDNFASYSFIAPVYVAQTSYYKSFQGLRVTNAQFSETVDNGDMLVIMRADDGTVYNTTLHANEQIVVSPATVDEAILAALSADLTTTTPIETDTHNTITVI